MNHRIVLPALACAAALFFGGCGDETAVSAPGAGDRPVTDQPATGGGGPGVAPGSPGSGPSDPVPVDPGPVDPGGSTMLDLNVGLPAKIQLDATDQRPSAVAGLQASADGSSLLVGVWGDPCTAIAAVDLVETDTEIRVGVTVGRAPGAGDVCAEIAQLSVVTMPLASPVGSRTLTDVNMVTG